MVPYISNFFESSNLFACDVAASSLNWSIAFLCDLVLSSFNFFELNQRVQKSTFTPTKKIQEESANVRTHALRKLYK